jgi:hypothetical protein
MLPNTHPQQNTTLIQLIVGHIVLSFLSTNRLLALLTWDHHCIKIGEDVDIERVDTREGDVYIRDTRHVN